MRKKTPAGTERETETGEDGGHYHISVMLEEVMQALQPGPGRVILDGTLGGGGHTEEFLQRGAAVVALDQDPDALAWAAARLQDPYAERLTMRRSNFADFPAVLQELGMQGGVDGLFFDLGVSSHQVDEAARGFSFQKDGPLDMRMDPAGPVTAADLINTLPEEELARIFYEYGEEKASRRVARAILRQRERAPFQTTGELAAAVATVIPRKGAAHPATRVFQAVRMAVNDELGALERVLAVAHHWLKPGGRLAFLTFHSLEDRMVKTWLRAHSEAFIDRPEWPAPRVNPECWFRLISRKGEAPGEAEISRNSRSRSARLRVAERLETPAGV